MRLECRCPKEDKKFKQNNCCDCGVFALLFAEYASCNAQFNFTETHQYRTKIVANVATMKIEIPPPDAYALCRSCVLLAHYIEHSAVLYITLNINVQSWHCTYASSFVFIQAGCD